MKFLSIFVFDKKEMKGSECQTRRCGSFPENILKTVEL